ncbi:hypothetical protein [Methylobacterium symbioticum]|nr:hypothetical protein [uncultured Methylobacterium sp.]
MDWKRASAVMGGTAAFAAAVAVGAFAIVSLSPGERPVLPAQQGLLIENATALKPFAASARPVPPPAGVSARERADLAETDALRPDLPVTGGEGPGADGAHPAEPAPRAAARARSASQPVPPARAPAADPEPGPARESAPPQRQRLAALPRAEPRADLKPDLKPARPAPAVQAAPPGAPPDGLLTPGEIRRMRLSLRLTREQEPYWPPLEQALLEISAQQSAMVRAGQDPKEALGIGAGMRIYGVARPFLDQLREDQKAQVRARARAMGFGSIASQI